MPSRRAFLPTGIARGSRRRARRMKVFITHAFGGDDELLASALKEDLGEAGITGYLAEKTQRYDLLIGDKIRQEIDESDWLVAIITKRSHASASVHEEIGYALGRGVRVALMLEEGVEKSGVLVYGREYEVFSVPEFARHSRKMARFIAGSPRPAPRPPPSIGEAATALLESRNILSAESADFAQNARFAGLYSGLLGDDEKPAFLFTAIPHDLGDYDVTADEFAGWVGSVKHLEVQGRQIPVRETYQEIDIGTLRVVKKYPGASPGKDILTYREFLSSGLFEYGTSHLFLGRNDAGQLSLYLPYMVGEFWGFVAYARSFYQKIGMRGRFTVLLSIRNSSELALEDYGDEAADPVRMHANMPLPAPQAPLTDRYNIQISHTFASADGLSNEEIAGAVRKAARTTCNAYGVSAPRCYDSGGRFAWKLWRRITSW